VVTVAGTPTGYGSTVEYDFIQQLGYGNSVLSVGFTPVSVVGTTYTFTPAELPRTLKAGDYITLAGFTPVPNMPDEAVVALVHAVSCRVYRLRGDFNSVKSEQEELQNAILYLQQSSFRIESKDKRPVVQSNAKSLTWCQIQKAWIPMRIRQKNYIRFIGTEELTYCARWCD